MDPEMKVVLCQSFPSWVWACPSPLPPPTGGQTEQNVRGPWEASPDPTPVPLLPPTSSFPLPRLRVLPRLQDGEAEGALPINYVADGPPGRLGSHGLGARLPSVSLQEKWFRDKQTQQCEGRREGRDRKGGRWEGEKGGRQEGRRRESKAERQKADRDQ